MGDDDAYYGRVRLATLEFIRDHPGVTVDAISKGISMSQADIVPILLLLEEQGLIITSDNIEESSTLWKYYPAPKDK